MLDFAFVALVVKSYKAWDSVRCEISFEELMQKQGAQLYLHCILVFIIVESVYLRDILWLLNHRTCM